MKLVLKYLIVGLVFTFLTGANTIANSSAYITSEEERFSELFNQFRSALGLQPVTIHSTLQSVARNHSQWMASKDFLSHYGPEETQSPFDRMHLAGYQGYSTAGENIACGNGDPTQAFLQWIFSPSHLENMLNPHYDQMGIARAGTGNEKCPYYWTHDLASMTPRNPARLKVTDTDHITRVLINIIGSLPQGKFVRLPGQVEPTPQPDVSQLPNLQCTIPNAIAKTVFAVEAETDILLKTEVENGNTFVKIVYVQNGRVLPYRPLYLSQVILLKNIHSPIYTLITQTSSSADAFVIQFESKFGRAQFNRIQNTDSKSHPILCSIQNAE